MDEFAALIPDGKPLADLYALDRLNTHKTLREARVQFLGVGHHTAEPAFQTFHAYFRHAARRVAVLSEFGYFLHCERFRLFAEHTRLRLFGKRELFERVFIPVPNTADLFHVPAYLDTERGKILFIHAARGYAYRRFPRRRAFQNISRVFLPELDHARKIGVTGTDFGQRFRAHNFFVAIAIAHTVRPVGEIFIENAKGDGTAQRFAVAYARQDLRFVAFNLLPCAAAVTALS